MKRIVNCETGEVIERELNEEELKQQAKEQAAELKRQKEIADREEQRQALLDKLGITEAEAELLLG